MLGNSIIPKTAATIAGPHMRRRLDNRSSNHALMSPPGTSNVVHWVLHSTAKRALTKD